MQIEWVHQVDFCGFFKAAITCAWIDLPISVHNDRHFSANGFVTVRPIAMKFTRYKRLRQRIRIKVLQNFTWMCQISLHEINDDVQT